MIQHLKTYRSGTIVSILDLRVWMEVVYVVMTQVTQANDHFYKTPSIRVSASAGPIHSGYSVPGEILRTSLNPFLQTFQSAT